MYKMTKVEAEDPREPSLVSTIPAASTSELEHKQDSKDMCYQIVVIKEEVAHDWCHGLDQQKPEPNLIKHDREEMWLSQEEEQLTVKSEDEEKPQVSELCQIKTEDGSETEDSMNNSAEQMKTEPHEEDCGGPEPDRNPFHSSLESTMETDKKDFQVLVIKEEVTHECASGLDQQDSELHSIKHEREDMWISQEEEQLTVKSEDEEKPQISELLQIRTENNRDTEDSISNSAEQMKTEPHEEDCEGSQPNRNPVHSSQESTMVTDNKGKRSKLGSKRGKLIDCTVCRQRFPRPSYIKSHKSVHSGEKPFVCSACIKGCSLKQSPKRHMGVHSEGKEFICSVCSETFSNQGTLNRHIRVHTRKKRLICKVCSKVFSKKGNLKTHMRAHTGEKPFVCNVCRKGFSQQCNLNSHMRVHTGEKPFVCNVCSKGFSQQFSLKSHMRVHTGEKPFICSVCSKIFALKRTLNRHMRVHTGEKTFFCNVCSKGFSRQGNLNSHMHVHTGEKPFICNVCSKSFSLQCNLKRHMRVHTGEKPFICNVCSKGFSQPGSLNRHMRVHTENVVNL
uniref:Zinc finger protein 260-like n=1 Tax=Fundulus heteroclitus TaxID=8078 RepID=A0A3Q2PGK1_FUNHE